MKFNAAVALVAVTGAVGLSWADGNTFTWINTANQRRGLVENEADWQDGLRPVTDKNLSLPQTNDTFVFSSETAWEQSITGPSAGYGSPYYMGTIVGTFSHYLMCVATHNYRWTVLKDASEFEGAIGAESPDGTGSGGFLLLANATLPRPHVKNFRAMGGPTLGLLENNATGVLDHVSGYGFFRAPYVQGWSAFTKNDTVVEIGAVEGGATLAAHVSVSGTLLVHGSAVETPAVVGSPAFHLDANAKGSLTFDGDRLVRWADVDGRDFAAVKDGDNLAPTVERDDRVDLDLVNFGALRDRADQVPHCGNSSTLVFEGGAIENIREVFLVFRDQPVYQRPIPGEGNTVISGRWNWQISQNFLGSAKDAPQYFTRVTQRRSGKGWYFSHLINNGTCSGGNYCFDYNPSTAHMKGADVRLDGAFALPSMYGEFDHEPHVLSLGLRYDGAQADRFACNGCGSLGGIRLGEVIVYTNALSLAQRREINAYLMAKWHPEKPNDLDFKWVKADSGARLKAASGTLRVGQYDVGTSAMTMDGNLDVTTLKGSDLSLAFANGASNLTLRTDTFAQSVAVPDGPAGDPHVWFDANRGTTLLTTNVNGYGETTYVTKWVDARDGTNAYGYAVTATRVSVNNQGSANRLALDEFGTGHVVDNSYCAWPTLKTVGSLKMLDLGPQHQDDVSHSSDPFTYTDPTTGTEYPDIKQLNYFRWEKARDGVALGFGISKSDSTPTLNYGFTTIFWVLQVNEDTCYGAGGTSVKTPYAITVPSRSLAFAESLGLARHYGISSNFADAEWYVNGERVDSHTFTFEKGKTYVVGVRLRQSHYESLANFAYIPSGAGSGTYGGLCFGEYLAYAYALPDADYLATESYLMKRWLDADHPAKTRATQKLTLTKLAYADAAQPTVTNERDLDVGILDTGASDRIVKRGAGSLAIASAKTSVRNYAAAGGPLEATVDWLDDAALRLDASKYASFVWKDGEEGKSVARWNDSRGNGLYVKSQTSQIRDPMEWLDQPGVRVCNFDSGMTNAQYRVSDGTDGLKSGVPYVDCLEYRSYLYFDNTTREWLPSQVSGCSYLLGASNDCAGLVLSSPFRNLREYHVVYASNGMLIPVNSANLDVRGQVPGPGQGQFFYHGKTAGSSGWNAHTASRCWDSTGEWNTNNGCPSLGTTFHVFSFASADDVDMDYLAMDRSNGDRGGAKFCEVICFTGKTNTTERANAIHDYLLAKWQAIGSAAAPAIALDSVAATEGGSVRVNTDDAPVSVKALAVSVAAGAVGTLAFEGEIDFPTGSRLTLTLDDSLARKRGTWPVVTSAGVLHPENLTVVFEGSSRVASRARTFWEDGVLKLRLSTRGAAVWVR